MAIFVPQICVGLDAGEPEAISQAARILKINFCDVKNASICKKSVDARKKNNIRLVYAVCFEFKDPGKERAILRKNPRAIFRADEKPLDIRCGNEKLDGRPVVVGFGPAGIFASYVLAKNGYRPVVIEQGDKVDARVKKVEKFWSEGVLDEQTNVQFGEGGAGAFSDGKLVTRINDPLCKKVIDLFIKHGALADIRTQAKPHIGTDFLRNIIKSIRLEIISLGAQIRFNEKLERIKFENGRIFSIITSKDEIKTSALILAIGHSARDTFEMLLENGVEIEPKPFSVGVRIEHLQRDVEKALYGDFAGHFALPRAEYAYSYRINGRGVYTFCMCPGGVVVPAASEKCGVVTNGMSEHLRDGENANSALVVGVSKKDFGSGPLDGMLFQRKIERMAFEAGDGKYFAPMTNVGAYLSGAVYKEGKVKPTYHCGTKIFDINKLFPNFVNDMLKAGIRQFDRKLSGFAEKDAIITAPETRTSSPIRILRNDRFASSVDGLYPCGEGAGYAGGIMSAAVDGIKVAGALIERFAPD